MTIADNGLGVTWDGRIWLNPPYGQDTEIWMEKFIRSNCTGCMLVFARTDVKWFHNLAVFADALCFVKGRIRFIRGDGFVGQGCGAASLLIARGDDCVKAIENSKLGFTVHGKGV